MNITKYTTVNLYNEWDQEYDTYEEALNAAKSHETPHAVLELTFEYTDSELAWAPDGGNVWPPEDS